MKSRFLPYATTPARLTAQLISDLLVIAWITVWVMVGLAVHHAIAMIAGVGRQVNDSANGLSDSLNSAGDSADRIPLVGDTVAKPLRAASEAALDLAGAGQNLNTTATSAISGVNPEEELADARAIRSEMMYWERVANSVPESRVLVWKVRVHVCWC
jgi:hypothetical protein